MHTTARTDRRRPHRPQVDVDVLIVGAGLSGIGAACTLQRELPDTSYTILEARQAMGGTWDLFRYPGIRSDSDMYTLGFTFEPWRGGRSIADGEDIRRYVVDTARRYGVDRHIRYGHRVVSASWSTPDSRWTVTVELSDGGQRELTCRFLYMCSGYYRYDQGYTPDFPGVDRFGGQLVHPQHWPTDLDVRDRRVVVIGSGATAVTLIPALVERGAAHVTMLQRSPSYIMPLPHADPIADGLKRLLPEQAAYTAIRWKNVGMATASYQLARRRPRLVKGLLRRLATRMLPEGYDVDTHFTPDYEPWDQRLCVAPDGDLFQAIRAGGASVVTDRIATFTEQGVRLESGEELAADVVITATGLNVQLLGGATIQVDGRQIDAGQTVAYKGMMVSDVPNLAFSLGYTNASWTLKAELIARYVCRLLAHMDRHGYSHAVPVAPAEDGPLPPLIDLQAGYVKRAAATLPRQGQRYPWRLHQNYLKDIGLFRRAPLEDEGIRFVRHGQVPVDRPLASATT